MALYCAFISPSGNGLKILYKLENEINNPYEFENIYLYYADEFCLNFQIEVDKVCKDVSHSCYISFDADLYFNENADCLKTDIKDEDELIYEGAKKYLIEVKNEVFRDGNKQNFLVKLAGICNQYGADKSKILKKAYDEFSNVSGVQSVSYGDFESIINRVYKAYQNQFRTKHYERHYQNRCFKTIDVISEFWDLRDNKVQLLRERLISFLQDNGFYKMYYGNSYIFIRIKNNIISEVSTTLIKDFVLEKCKNINVFGLREQLLKSHNIFFTDSFLSSLETIQPEIKRDTKDEAFIYFKNCWVKVTKNGLETNSYFNLEGLIWERQITKYQFEANNKKGDFESFINNICRNNFGRIESLKSSIGYLIHSFKNSSNAKAIIYLDEKIGDGSYGRCGKSIIGKAIAKIKNCIEEDGRNFKFGGNFAFQKINLDTQIYFINDAGEDFPFNKMFAMITDSMTIEKKNKDAVIIPFEESPKILITTNHVIKENDYSTIDRKFEVEFSDYYNINHKPINDFGKMFFNEWDGEEWNSFFMFMLGCLQLYLEKGFIKTSFINLETKRLIESTCSDFVNFMEEMESGKEYNKKEEYSKFVISNPDNTNLKQKTFTKWIKTYADYKKLKYLERRSNRDLYFTIS